jgi:GntR family transcriptional regulator/MocR family aminotransferase
MKNIIFALKTDSPKYKQIYEKLKSLIEQGNLKTNEQLPSIRELAHSLHVSRNTTLMAYEQLVAEGYIRGEGRKGYFINALETLLFQEAVNFQNEKQIASLDPIVVDFRAGAVNQQHFPLKIWRRMYNQVLTLPETFQYGSPFGEECLKKQIARYLFQSRGVKADTDSIIIGSSTQQMLIHLAYILKDDYQSIIVENPGYDGARESFAFHQFSFEALSVYETGADLSELSQMNSKLIYVTPSHHSPYGVSMSIQQRQVLIQWITKLEGYIIEDDYDSEFRYTQQPFPALASINSSRVIYLGNFSKSFLPGIRISYMVLPKSLIMRYKNQFLNFESTCSLPNQLAMAKFMESGEWHRHIKRMRLVYKQKMKYVVSQLKNHFAKDISIIGEQSGLYVLIKVHLNYKEDCLIQQAASYGVRVYPTSIYFVNNNIGDATLKLGFTNLSFKEIEKGVGLLKEAWLGLPTN